MCFKNIYMSRGLTSEKSSDYPFPWWSWDDWVPNTLLLTNEFDSNLDFQQIFEHIQNY